MSRIARCGLALALALLLPRPLGAITVEQRSPVDPSGFTLGPDDCRDTSPRSCRGLLLVDASMSPPLRGTYLALGVTNADGVDYDDLWVTLDGFFDEDPPGDLVRIAPGEAENPGDPRDSWLGAYRIGPLADGETRTAFFYLEVTDSSAPLPFGPEVRPDATVWDGPPLTSPIVPANPLLAPCPLAGRMCGLPTGAVEIPFVYLDTIQSSANRIFQITTVPASPVVGGALTVTVIGDTGKTGFAADYDGDGDPDALLGISPSGLAGWPANALELVSTEIAFSGADACGLADCSCSMDPPAPGECAFVRPDGGAPACETRAVAAPDISTTTCVVQAATDSLEVIFDGDVRKEYVAVYTFRPTVPVPPQPLGPVQYVSSGAQIKHNDLDPLALCVDPISGEVDPQETGCCLDPDVSCTGEVTAGATPGRVPADGLIVTHNPSDPAKLDLAWGASCGGGATGYAIYEGTLGLFYDHQVFNGLCGVTGTAMGGETPGLGDHYYVVVPLSPTEEGSYGTDSAGAERPASGSACLPARNVAPCP